MALSADAITKLLTGEYDDFAVETLVTIYRGAMVGIKRDTGYARGLVAGDVFAGHAQAQANNSAGAAAAINVQTRRGRYPLEVTLASVAITDVGKTVYASDDATLTLTQSTNTPVGKVQRYVTTNTCVVEFNTTLGQMGTNLLYANVADSAEVENSTVETAFDKSVTIRGEELQIGDVIHVFASGMVNDQNSTDTLTVKLYVGTEEIISLGAVDVADSDIFAIDAYITIRTLGASGTLVAVGTYVAPAAAGTAAPLAFRKASATEDISAAVAITVKGTWSVAHADNEVQLDCFIAELLR